jgi:hypothetical protein
VVLHGSEPVRSSCATIPDVGVTLIDKMEIEPVQ